LGDHDSVVLDREAALKRLARLRDLQAHPCFSELESEHALVTWFEAAAPISAGAYLAYRAAVDREEAAARDLQRLSELTWPYQEQLARAG
jgi:hypothetical protein